MISLKEQLDLEGKQINSKRIKNFAILLKAESRKLIETEENGKSDFRKYQMKLESLLDVSPTSTTDLSSKLSSIAVEKLMESINDTASHLLDCALIIERRVALHNALFPDDKEEFLSEKELDFLSELSVFQKKSIEKKTDD
jgi:hypothetical protein